MMAQTAAQVTSMVPRHLNYLNLDPIRNAAVIRDPFPYLVAHGVLAPETMKPISDDFPEISEPGFFPLTTMKRQGAFDHLLADLENPALSALLTEKFGIDIRDKPQIITVRKWSAAKDGRIHNDGEAKVVNSLLYLNPVWSSTDTGGRFRVLRSDKSFDDMAPRKCRRSLVRSSRLCARTIPGTGIRRSWGNAASSRRHGCEAGKT